MELDFVTRGNGMISPPIYCWEETDSTYYAETFFLLPPRENVFTCSCRSGKCRNGCNFYKTDLSCTENLFWKGKYHD